jgi:diaminohydroxyphosphoribosylaminopyrimidine deaminase/5-amino-6-(5-phosphoribosylamino)uracil reductase
MNEDFMRRALVLARQGAGRVSPNPLVGCVIVRDGRILGEGAHLEFGGPHAEPNAIAHAESRGESVEGATVYVTLEPHSHQGKTPPCSDLLIQKRIACCVIAMQDPYPEVNGRGIEQLRNAGIEVDIGLLESDARELNRFFIKHVTTGLPYVTLKVAQSADGRSALANGESRWITGEASQRRVHELRAEHDAVLVGASTALADDPALTVRHVEGRQPWRVVLDARADLPDTLKLFSDAVADKTILVAAAQTAGRARDAHKRIADVLGVPDVNGRIDLRALFGLLASRGIASVLIEAGPKLAASIAESGLADELQLFIAPILLGGDARPSFGGFSLQDLASAHRFRFHRVERIGDDVLLVLRT